MPINPDAVGATGGVVRSSWSSSDALLYALAVGANADDPIGPELAFVSENTSGLSQQVLPTFVVIPGIVAGSVGQFYGDFDRAKLVHAEQSVQLMGPLPVAASVDIERQIVGVWDKGAGAIIETATETRNVSDNSLLAITRAKSFVKGEGGWGGERGQASPPSPPRREPDFTVEYQTLPTQALLYRLTNDRNPLHSDPAFAARGGHPRPILHGLCTFGFTGRALLSSLCDLDPSRFVSMSARFTRPVLPGQALRIAIWRTSPTTASFRTFVDNEVVVDGGQFEFHFEATS